MKTLTLILRWTNDITAETFSSNVKLNSDQLDTMPKLGDFLESVYLKLQRDVDKHIKENPDL